MPRCRGEQNARAQSPCWCASASPMPRGGSTTTPTNSQAACGSASPLRWHCPAIPTFSSPTSRRRRSMSPSRRRSSIFCAICVATLTALSCSSHTSSASSPNCATMLSCSMPAKSSSAARWRRSLRVRATRIRGRSSTAILAGWRSVPTNSPPSRASSPISPILRRAAFLLRAASSRWRAATAKRRPRFISRPIIARAVIFSEMVELLAIDRLRVRFRALSPVRAWLAGIADPMIDAVADVSLAIPAGGAFGQVAMTFQDPIGSLSPRLTVRALVSEPFRVHGIGDRALDAEARRLLALVGLAAPFLDRYPHELSGGQARRVGIARALALDPRLLIADEPTAGLDVSVQGEVLNLLARLRQELGIALLLITHNLAAVRLAAERLGVMYMGRLVETGLTAGVFRNPAHPYTAALLAAIPIADPT